MTVERDGGERQGSVAEKGGKLPARILSVRELLSDTTLAIPQYQRPYKWTTKNVNQLLADIVAHGHKSAYRLGTVVFHAGTDKDGKDVKNIVDGQQRTITLLLAMRALIQIQNGNEIKKIKRENLVKQLNDLAGMPMVDPKFASEISKANIHGNYQEIIRVISRPEFTEDHVDFLLNKCQIVTVTLSDVSEAFQFFDSQNARGRDLDPHDLLKAYHLREFSEGDRAMMAETVALWENSNQQEMAALFSQYLYRIRNWSRGESARYFGKDDIGLFKGVNIDTVGHYPYVEQLRIAHHFVDQYNRQYERKIDGAKLDFPFHLDQIIINGRRFFEMTNHYQGKVAQVRAESMSGEGLVNRHGLAILAKKIIETINGYEGMHRTGDRYVREMFDCLLIYYIDKFGHAEISRAIEKVFIWAYSLRLQMQSVQLASMDNYVFNNNLFVRIKEATRPIDFLDFYLPSIAKINSKKTEKIETLFKDMNYLEVSDAKKENEDNGK